MPAGSPPAMPSSNLVHHNQGHQRERTCPAGAYEADTSEGKHMLFTMPRPSPSRYSVLPGLRKSKGAAHVVINVAELLW